MNHKGFTLIELMIVVVIIGILAAVGIPQYQNYVARAQVADGLSMATSIKTAISEYYSTHGKYPSDNTALGIDSTFDIKGKYVRGIKVDDGRFEVIFNKEPDAHKLIQNKSFYMIPTDEGGSISWRCACGATKNSSCVGGGMPSGRQIDEKYLPSSCLLTGKDTDTDTDTDTDWADAKAGDNACWDGSKWIVGNLSPTIEGVAGIHTQLNGYADLGWTATIDPNWECYP